MSISLHDKVAFAPETTTMQLSPSLFTVISAVPVIVSVLFIIRDVSTPALPRLAIWISAYMSQPTAPSMVISAPRYPAAHAWLAPLPPGIISILLLKIVSPVAGV